AKLMNKLWNVSRFSSRFLTDAALPQAAPSDLTLADRWILARLQLLIKRVTAHFHAYDYASAKSETEQFFWKILADNYLEMAKMRLYGDGNGRSAALFTLFTTLQATLKLFAPFFPFVTERIYTQMFAAHSGESSIHRASWPEFDAQWVDETAVSTGDMLIEIATAVRRYKSEHNLGLGTDLAQLQISTSDPNIADLLAAGTRDLQSITRAQSILFTAADGGENGRIAIIPTLAISIDA
ncbi:MAG: class I tRNA ligase family protein, partial [Chloroflexi bacterium]|nr:class I tRNA ligase family protein [Chloroflexota bacterium]